MKTLTPAFLSHSKIEAEGEAEDQMKVIEFFSPLEYVKALR